MSIMKTVRYFLLAGFIWLANSCGDPLEDFKIHISPDYYSSGFNLILQDYASQELLSGAIVQFGGDYGDRIFYYDGSKSFDISEGVALFIADFTKGEEAISFTIEVSKPGYLPFRKLYSISFGDVLDIRVPLINENNSSDDVSISESTVLLDNGSITSPLELVVAPNSGIGQSAKIEIPAGILFQDENGNLLTGELTVRSVFFQHGTVPCEIMKPNSFFGAINVDDNNGKKTTYVDFGSSFLSIDMTVDGTVVNSFSQGELAYEIEIPDDSWNGTEERDIEAGDSIQLVSHTDGNAFWNISEMTQVTERNGKLFLSGSTNHLSEFSYVTLSENDFILWGDKFFFAYEDGLPFTGEIILEYKTSTSDWKVANYIATNAEVYDCCPVENHFPIDPPKRFKMKKYNGVQPSLFFLTSGLIGQSSNGLEGRIRCITKDGIELTPTRFGSGSHYGSPLFGGASFPIDYYLYTLTPPPPPRPFDAKYRIQCEGEDAVLYPPKYTKIFVRPKGSLSPTVFDEDYFFISESGQSQLPLEGVISGQEYTVTAWFGFFKLWEDDMVVNSDPDYIHPIVLNGGECDVLKSIGAIGF